MRKRPANYRYKKKEEPYRVNHRIRARRVMVVGENISPGVYLLEKALEIAAESGVDLVEIAPNATPPVCKVIDYTKFKYERKKKLKGLNTKAQKTVLKEVRFTPTTDEHDFNFKRKHIIKFLEEGAKVRIYVQFKGREFYTMRETSKAKLLDFAKSLDLYGKVDGDIKMHGRRATLLIISNQQKK